MASSERVQKGAWCDDDKVWRANELREHTSSRNGACFSPTAATLLLDDHTITVFRTKYGRFRSHKFCLS